MIRCFYNNLKRQKKKLVRANENGEWPQRLLYHIQNGYHFFRCFLLHRMLYRRKSNPTLANPAISFEEMNLPPLVRECWARPHYSTQKKNRGRKGGKLSAMAKLSNTSWDTHGDRRHFRCTLPSNSSVDANWIEQLWTKSLEDVFCVGLITTPTTQIYLDCHTLQEQHHFSLGKWAGGRFPSLRKNRFRVQKIKIFRDFDQLVRFFRSSPNGSCTCAFCLEGEQYWPLNYHRFLP